MDITDDYTDMHNARELFMSKHSEMTNAYLFHAVNKAWTWGWVAGKEYFKKEKDDGNTLQG